MAVDVRHAAWQPQTRFAVRLLAESGAETELASSLPDLTAATEFALEWLNREDPEREGKVHLAIVRADDDGARTVWVYPPAERSPGRDLVALFGFNPATWQPQSLHRPPRPEPRRSLGGLLEHRPELGSGRGQESTAAPGPRAVLAPRARRFEPVAAGESDAGERSPVARKTPRTQHDWALLGRAVAAALRESWDDLLSRVLLVVAAFSTGFALALLEPAFLVLSLSTLAALWVRRRRLAEDDPGDDF
jgi:hypothetical protein